MITTEEKKKYDPKTERGTKGKANTEEKKAYMRQYQKEKKAFDKENDARIARGEEPLSWQDLMDERKAQRDLEAEQRKEEKKALVAQQKAEERRIAREKAREINNELFQKCLANMDTTDGAPLTAKNTEQIQFTIQIMNISRNADKDNIETLYQCLQDYITLCATTDHKIGNQAAAAACGLNNRTLWAWLSAKDPQKKKFAETVYNICSMYREQLMQDGQINPVTGIFWQKNYDGLRDQQEMVVTPNNPLGEQKDAKAIAEKYAALPD